MPNIVQKYAVTDFSGGLTTDAFTAQPNQGSKFQNLLITQNKKLIQRQGFTQLQHTGVVTRNGTTDQVGAAAKISRLVIFQDTLFAFSSGNCYYWDQTSGWVTLEGPDQGSGHKHKAFPYDNANHRIYTEIVDNHLYCSSDNVLGLGYIIKIYKDGSSPFQLRTAGFDTPGPMTSFNYIPGVISPKHYLYACVFYYSYSIGSVTYEDYSSVYYHPTTIVNEGDPSSSNIVMLLPQCYTNQNWDVLHTKTKVYRTIDDGTTFYYVGEMTHDGGVTTLIFTDNVSDTTLQTRSELYTTGGVLDNDFPQSCKFIKSFKNTLRYYNTVWGSATFYQGVFGDPDSRLDIQEKLSDTITGVAAIGDTHIAFCENGQAFSIEGGYEENGQGYTSISLISKDITCISHNSIIDRITDSYFAAEDGFYVTDGVNFKKLGMSAEGYDNIGEIYKSLISTISDKQEIFGARDSKNNRIYWVIPTSTTYKIFVYHELFNSFTYFNNITDINGSNVSIINPVSILIAWDYIYFGDTSGRVYQQALTQAYDSPWTDEYYDTAKSIWTTKAVIYDYKSAGLDLGDPTSRKMANQIIVATNNIKNLSASVLSTNDNANTSTTLKELDSMITFTWGDPDLLWGNVHCRWNHDVYLTHFKRMFTKNKLRCTYKTIEITNSLSDIMGSSDKGNVTVTSATKTIVLDTALVTWPTNIIDYYIYLEGETYVYPHRIRTVDGSYTTITVDDSGSHLVDGSQKFIVRGYKKDRPLSLIDYTINYVPVGESYNPYRAENEVSA